MSTPQRTPKLGDIVVYYESVSQDVWDPVVTVPRPAIVTEVVTVSREHPNATVRLTVFRPWAKPLWDISATHSDEPQPGYWSWPVATGS